jgi:predicted nucleotidyltransferase
VSALEVALRGLLGRLSAHGARYAIVGGLAVSARTEPRFTRDADICVAVADDAEAERLIHALRADGYRALALVEQEDTARIATVRLGAPTSVDEGVVLDLLFASSGLEPEVVASSEKLELFEGLAAPVASVPALIALKVLARDDAQRPQDRVDLVSLLSIAMPGDLAAARELLELIDARGYARGRDLQGALEGLRAELGV